MIVDAGNVDVDQQRTIEERAEGIEQKRKLFMHSYGRLAMAGLVLLVVGGHVGFGTLEWQRAWPIGIIVACNLVLWLVCFNHFHLWWRFREREEPFLKRYSSYPFWPFFAEIPMLIILCAFTGGTSSVFLSMFFVHATLGHYALGRGWKLFVLTGLAAGGMLASGWLGGKIPTDLLLDELTFAGTGSLPALLVFAVVSAANLGFAAYASHTLADRVERDHYSGEAKDVNANFKPLQEYFVKQLSVEQTKATEAIQHIAGALKYRRAGTEFTQNMEGENRTVTIRTRLPARLPAAVRKRVQRRAYERLPLAEALGSVHVVTKAEQLWSELILKFHQWKDDSDILPESEIDPDEGLCFINISKQYFEKVLNEPVLRQEWLVLLPYCLRPDACPQRL